MHQFYRRRNTPKQGLKLHYRKLDKALGPEQKTGITIV
jgi:hypothetical protein